MLNSQSFWGRLGGVARLGPLAVALLVLPLQPTPTRAAESAVPEYRVKALFLINFAKYVEWPGAAFPSPTSPIIIGLIGENRFGDNLANAVAEKAIDGHPVVLRQLGHDDSPLGCHILFISGSEKSRFPELLERLKNQPILTVSDINHFAEQGGIIGFVKKEDRIRLAIDLGAAHRANLQLSSKLLSVADSVHGKN